MFPSRTIFKWLVPDGNGCNVYNYCLPLTRSSHLAFALSLTILGIRTSFSTYRKWSPRAHGGISSDTSLVAAPTDVDEAAILELSFPEHFAVEGVRRSGGGGILLYKKHVDRYVPPQRVWFWRFFGLKTVINFAHFGLESGMVFEGTTGVMNVFVVSVTNKYWERKTNTRIRSGF